MRINNNKKLTDGGFLTQIFIVIMHGHAEKADRQCLHQDTLLADGSGTLASSLRRKRRREGGRFNVRICWEKIVEQTYAPVVNAMFSVPPIITSLDSTTIDYLSRSS